MKKIAFLIAGAAISIAAGTASFAAELPSYEVAGFPISPVQVQVLGSTHVQEQSKAPDAISPHQLGVLTPRRTVTTANANR